MCKFIMKIMMIRTLWGLKPLQGYIHLRTVYRLWSDGNNGGHSGGKPSRCFTGFQDKLGMMLIKNVKNILM